MAISAWPTTFAQCTIRPSAHGRQHLIRKVLCSLTTTQAWEASVLYDNQRMADNIHFSKLFVV